MEIFKSPELLVSDLRQHASACCVVTFDSYTDNRTLDHQGFGEAFFDAIGIDAIHIVCRNNDWYQHPEIDEACRRVRALLASYPHVVAYGQSMGGYDAIRLGSRVGAQVALAISPQFSIAPAVAPFRAALAWRFEPHRFSGRTARRPRLRRQSLCRLRSAQSRCPACGTPLSAAYRDRRYKAAQLWPPCVDLHGRYGHSAAGGPRPLPRHVRYPEAARASAPGPTWLADPVRQSCLTLSSRPALRAAVGQSQCVVAWRTIPPGQYTFTLAHNEQFGEALAIFEKERADGSINSQMPYWESEVHLLHGNVAKAIAVSEEALALDPEASVFVDRVQKLRTLECPSESSPPSMAPSLGVRLRARLQKAFKLGMKKA